MGGFPCRGFPVLRGGRGGAVREIKDREGEKGMRGDGRSDWLCRQYRATSRGVPIPRCTGWSCWAWVGGTEMGSRLVAPCSSSLQRPANTRAPDPARARMHANQSLRACASALSWGSSSRPSRSAARTHNRYSHHALYAYVPWCLLRALFSIKIGLFI